MPRIVIMSGTTDYGGSTWAHIYLSNLLCEAGYDCSLWGPHENHIGKCRGGLIKDLTLCHDDIVLSHFIPAKSFSNMKFRMHVLTLHETLIFPLRAHHDSSVYDKVHFVCEAQRRWHNFPCNGFVCHPVLDPTLRMSRRKPSTRVAGVIGSIDRNKQPHVSIDRALKDGHEKIRLYGKYVLKDGYMESVIEPLIRKYPGVISPPELAADRQSMYDSLTDVYISTVNEPWSYVRPECIITGTNYHGTTQIEQNFSSPMLTREEILSVWVKELGL